MRYLLPVLLGILLVAGFADDVVGQESVVTPTLAVPQDAPAQAAPAQAQQLVQKIQRVRWQQRTVTEMVKRVKWVPTIVEEPVSRTITEPVIEEIDVPVYPVPTQTICCPPTPQVQSWSVPAQTYQYQQPQMVVQSAPQFQFPAEVGVINAPRVERSFTGPRGATFDSRRSDNFMYNAPAGTGVSAIMVDGFRGTIGGGLRNRAAGSGLRGNCRILPNGVRR